MISDVLLSEYGANRLSGDNSCPGLGKKHEPKEVNHNHKITGALGPTDPSVTVK